LELRFIYQRAHRDYAPNADPQKHRRRVVEAVKKSVSAAVSERCFFDEFCRLQIVEVCSGWARDAAPVRSQGDERKRSKAEWELIYVSMLSVEKIPFSSVWLDQLMSGNPQAQSWHTDCVGNVHQTLHHSRTIIKLTSNHMQAQLAVHLEQIGL